MHSNNQRACYSAHRAAARRRIPSASSYDIAGDATSRAAAMVAASASSAVIGPVARSATSSAQAAHGSHATSWQVLIWPSFWHLCVCESVRGVVGCGE